ncbi:MAG: F0F1 ATP synthase subunit A [Bacteroidia bacterium]
MGTPQGSFANSPQEHPSETTEEHHESTSDSHVGEAHRDHDEHAQSAGHDEGHGEEEGFNAGDMIMHHISDAHDWHMFDYNGKSYSIPLPVIIYNKEKGLSVFSSSRFEHGHASYNGYKLDHGKVVNADANDQSGFYDISITKNVIGMFVSVLVLMLILFSVKKLYSKREGQAPKGIQSVLEPLIIFLRDEVVKPSIGKGYEKYMPLLLTIFFFIFANNLLGLIPFFPGGANVTGNIAVTVVLAVIVFIITQVIATKDYWKHIFLPDVPKALYPILIPIEILGVFTKPIVLALRLFANITAGHIIILGFFSLIFIFGQMNAGGGFGAAAFSMAFSLFMSMLELLVAFLQAYVFTLLSALYFGMALEKHAHEH